MDGTYEFNYILYCKGYASYVCTVYKNQDFEGCWQSLINGTSHLVVSTYPVSKTAIPHAHNNTKEKVVSDLSHILTFWL